jgi:gamma-polyglutamate synthase
MVSLAIVVVLISALLLYGGWERSRHQRRLHGLKIRIHVNGTRGKSSVTRLVAAGLRAHGIRTVAKTTGSAACLILPDGSEQPIVRGGRPTILEQLAVVATAAELSAEALVVECMALQPHLQAVSELSMLQSTHGVITNVRPDHLDVMGPTEPDVARALLGTTPPAGHLFTCELDYVHDFERACHDRSCRLHVIDAPECALVSAADLDGFAYVEHRENVALALAVCAELGVPRARALAGMWAATPDAGVLREVPVTVDGRQVIFVGGFAANDPESSGRIWEIALQRHAAVAHRIMVINTRADRGDRTRQLAEAIPKWSRAQLYVASGSDAPRFVRIARAHGLDPATLVNCSNQHDAELFTRIVSTAPRESLVVGLGNIASDGLALQRLFERAHLSERDRISGRAGLGPYA